jgi:nitroimidazol reductase NimA-like FMN-containing flavoprotein (pyridoxamine 5'-phosphate oxidase superfamily)
MESDANDVTTVLEEIGRQECLDLLAANSVGRLAVVDHGRPMVVPVNYRLSPDGIIVRTDVGTKLEAGSQHLVALEIDEIDSASHTGWSVLVSGHAFDVTETLDERSERLRAVEVKTWAPGPAARRLLIEVSEISGRRLTSA